MENALPKGFVLMDGVCVRGSQVSGHVPRKFVAGIMQMMDDWGNSLSFGKANIYSDEKIMVGKDRVRKGVILPYRLIRSSKGFSYYESVNHVG